MTQTTDQLAGDVPPPKRRKVDDDRPSSPLDHLPPPQNGQPDPPPPPPHDPPPQDNPRQKDPVKDGHAGDDPDKDNPAMEDPAMDDPAMEDPAKDDPAMEDPVMEDPTKKDPAKHDPAKHDPAKHDPAKHDPAKHDRAMDDPAKDDPAKDGPAKDVAPTDDPPKGDVPTDGFLADGVPKDGVPTDGVSTDGVSREGVLTDGVPKDGVPTDGVFKDGVPTDGVPIDDVSKNGVPMDDVSQDGVPKNGAPVDDVPRDNPPPIDPAQNDLPQSDPPQEAQPPPPPQEAPLPPHDTSPPPPPPAERAPHDLDPLDDMRPPRRQDIHGDEPHDPVALPVPMDTLQMPPTGLTPEVDAVLSKIFASGLFERKDVDGRALDFLASVSPQLALAALEDIQRRDFSTVRNKPAFIMSIFKRVVNAGGSLQPSVTGTAFQPTSVPASALAHLPPSVSDALQRVFQSGVCHPSQFDDRAMDILVDLAEPDAVRALSEFAAMEPGRVRNPSAFWMGLARKYKGHSRAPGGRAGPSYDGTTTTAYGAYDAYDARRPAVSSAMLEQRLDELAASGHLPRNALDDRAMDALRRLPEQDALGVLAELPEPARVRNMSAYVMGLCKKFAAGEARSLSQRGSYNTGGYGGYGGYSAYGASGYGGYGGYGHTGAHAGYATGYGAPGGYGSQYGAAVPGAYGTHPIDDNTRARETREALETMDPSVRDRFYQMTDQGIITESSFDARAISAMQNLRAEDACAALDELAASEPGRIHNISAYFMGLAKKFGRSSM